MQKIEMRASPAERCDTIVTPRDAAQAKAADSNPDAMAVMGARTMLSDPDQRPTHSQPSMRSGACHRVLSPMDEVMTTLVTVRVRLTAHSTSSVSRTAGSISIARSWHPQAPTHHTMRHRSLAL